MTEPTAPVWAPPEPRRSGELPGPPAPPAGWVPPPTPPRPRRRTPLVVGAVLSAVLAAVLALVAVDLHSASGSPRDVARSYFAALQRGDAGTALAYAADPPDGPYLTDEVLRAQLAVAPIDDLSVRQVSMSGSSATVAVRYQLGFAGAPVVVEDTTGLTRVGSHWRLARVASSVTLSGASAGTDRLVMLGRPLPTTAVLLFPGAVPVVAADSAVRVQRPPSVRLADAASVSTVSVVVAAAAQQTLKTALTTALNGCLRGTSKDPYCPQPDVDRPIPGSLRGAAATTSDGALISMAGAGGGRIDLSENVGVTGSWKLWDFDNQVVAKTGSVQVPVHAYASVDDLSRIYWAAPA